MSNILVRSLKSLTVVFLGLLLAGTAYAAKETIGIPAAVPIDDTVTAREAVRTECKLGEKVSSFLQRYAKNVKVSDDPNSGQYIDMSITEIFATAGGAWSGPKWMEVTGTLKNNGEDVASFRAKRFSTGGAFGGFKNTCSIIGRCSKAIAKDISIWLKNPVDGAELGDAK